MISLRETDLSWLGPGLSVLDLGCGERRQLESLVARGCRAVGIDPCPEAVSRCRARGLNVVQGRGEALPFDDESFDAVVSRVVLPYTDERRVVAEIARVLRPGGQVRLSCHGVAYHLYDALRPVSFKRMLYGLRSTVNSHVYRWTGRRLPGFLGDTLYQSRRAMRRYFRENGLIPRQTFPHDRYLGLPVFLYFAAEKPTAADSKPRCADIRGSCIAAVGGG
jgi:SAM-dependent methyltransferase